MAQYRNATPNMYFSGYKDSPKPGLQNGAVATPLHLPFTPVNAAWGPVGIPILCIGGEFVTQYGAETWNVRGAYYNHASLFAKMFQSKANAQYVYRLPNAGQKTAGVRLCLEYAPNANVDYQRNLDGTFKRDPSTGALMPDGEKTVTGYKFRLVFVRSDDMRLGTGTQQVGTLTGTGAATILPLVDMMGTYPGSRANNFGINIFQPKANNPLAVDTQTIQDTGDLIYRMFVTESSANGGSAKAWFTKMQTEYMDFTFGDAYSAKGVALGMEDMYKAMYVTQNQAYDGLDTAGPMDKIHVYQDNIDAIRELFYNAEAAIVDHKSFLHAGNKASVNLFDDTDYLGIPYHALRLATTGEYTEETYLAVEGSMVRPAYGSDGDLTLDTFDANVATFCDNFGKTSPNLADFKRFPFHFIWDSGYKPETKLKLLSLMSKRPELYVGACTFISGAPLNSMLDELALSTQLAAGASLYPESVLFKTPATRGHIMPWAIKLRGPNGTGAHEYTKPTTLNYDLAEKCCEYWGSSDGVWVTAKAFDTHPNNVIKHELLNYDYAPLPTRETMWGNQMIAVEFGDVKEVIYSGIQTINPSDSSVLNGVINIGATIHATWASIRANRKFVGQAIEEGLLIKRSNEEIALLTAGIDPNKAVVTPFTYLTPEDNDAGYAWTSGAKVSANGMKTVNTVEVHSDWIEG